MQKFLMALTAAGVLLAGTELRAAFIPIEGSQSYGLLNLTANSTNLLTATTFSAVSPPGGILVTGGTFNGLPGAVPTTFGFVGLNVGNFGLDVNSLSGFNFGNADYGTFQATTGVQSTSKENANGSRELSFVFLGTFAPGTNAAYASFNGNSFASNAASVILSFNQASPTSVISGSMSLQAPPDPRVVTVTTTPEPTSLALFGTMCIPLALGAFRRRQKAAQAAV